MNLGVWLRLDSGPGEPAFNMAMDEALLEAMPRLGRPLLRFYSWTEPAASFGYFQTYTEVERLTALRPLVRRPTGGGIVPHDADWTYSVVVPPTYYWYEMRAAESYRRMHNWLVSAFQLLGIATELAASPGNRQRGQCFAGHERYDLLYANRKVAGAAQRRRRDGLLIQGSVQPPIPGLERRRWQKAVCDAHARGGASWIEFQPDEPLHARAEALAQTKYSQGSYNRKK